MPDAALTTALQRCLHRHKQALGLVPPGLGDLWPDGQPWPKAVEWHTFAKALPFAGIEAVSFGTDQHGEFAEVVFAGLPHPVRMDPEALAALLVLLSVAQGAGRGSRKAPAHADRPALIPVLSQKFGLSLLSFIAGSAPGETVRHLGPDYLDVRRCFLRVERVGDTSDHDSGPSRREAAFAHALERLRHACRPKSDRDRGAPTHEDHYVHQFDAWCRLLALKPLAVQEDSEAGRQAREAAFGAAVRLLATHDGIYTGPHN